MRRLRLAGNSALIGGVVLALVLGLASCRPRTPDAPPLSPQEKADSLAAAVLDAAGGAEAWQSLPFLAFEFGAERDGERSTTAAHVWDRMTGAYRVEWTHRDTAIVALFNVRTREGRIFADGSELPSEAARPFLDRAYTRFINDTYWLLMPVKLLDPGVNRHYEADSSDAETEVLRLTFGQVGLTPGDTYWVYVDRPTGRVNRWAYVLQHNPDGPPTFAEWTDWQAYPASAGPVWMSSRKVTSWGALLTDRITTPLSVDPLRFLEP